MNQTVQQLPIPSSKHATCAWCRRDFDTIVQLIDHVDHGHLESGENERRRRFEPAA